MGDLQLEGIKIINDKKKREERRRTIKYVASLILVFVLSLVVSTAIFAANTKIDASGNDNESNNIGILDEDRDVYMICDVIDMGFYDDNQYPYFVIENANGSNITIFTDLEDVPDEVTEIVVKCNSLIEPGSFQVVGLR